MYIQALWLGKGKCDVTWEPAENVPTLVIKEFEQGSVFRWTVPLKLVLDKQFTHSHFLKQQAPSHYLNLVFVMHLLQGVLWWQIMMSRYIAHVLIICTHMYMYT